MATNIYLFEDVIIFHLYEDGKIDKRMKYWRESGDILKFCDLTVSTHSLSINHETKYDFYTFSKRNSGFGRNALIECSDLTKKQFTNHAIYKQLVDI